MRLSVAAAVVALATCAGAFAPQPSFAARGVVASASASSSAPLRMSAVEEAAADSSAPATKAPKKHRNPDPGDRDILVRAARGEEVERTPVWLMRQAGRYMAAFREYSTKYPFRQRSETPDMAVELSLQCHRAYGMDGIIMFSDILTPLPTLGIDFDVVKGTGPVISTEVRTEEDVAALADAETVDFDEKLPFIREILERLSVEAEEANTSLIGFVGAPFTLAAYTIEGKSSKACLTTKKMMMADEAGDSAAMSQFLDKLAVMIGNYGCHQIECGAQVVQVFESWAHQLSPKWFERFAKPAAKKAIAIMKEKHPDVPVIYFANGGSSYLELQRDTGADMIAIDWGVDMAQARSVLGDDVPVSGNLDPTVLFGTKEQIEQAVRDCIDGAGGPGKHLLNLGHGVMQGTPEEAVGWLVDECRRYKGKDV
uniref:Uroporphyrinogen decarboxylase n=1 Tax=Trieres chinensis TaxID=1514140 RepID=A0A7S1Z6K4_TRICV|eukprot:CAMPEP_0183305766 /NCGR_PEP_ID=MMETSP0160_2-20130417/10404_1 /TAXON_ID=2839 ORGANISM="Odontella Sinensis, Strain Grunow 1884" /NCGR_SAMPLE_ID=MMETSP0160_2 /ASSEMBLY_ACC=CAM_ASM_000250 /LENGTH=425 /DNA_ID=CAMNT_0025469029 /DNA_START=59 /DNA_END=1336 /DNA_ORIENTATION=-